MIEFAVAIISIAFFFESVFGFGGGLIAIPLLSLFLGVKDAVTLVLVFQLLMGALVIKTFKDIKFQEIKLFIPFLLVGTFIGNLTLDLFEEEILQNVLGTSILLFLFQRLVLKDVKLPKNSWIESAFGFVGGWFQGMIGTGGPPVTMFLSTVIKENQALRATLIFVLFVTSILRVLTSYNAGLFTSELTQDALLITPFFIGALYLGHKVHLRIPEDVYRNAVHTLLALSALMLLLK